MVRRAHLKVIGRPVGMSGRVRNVGGRVRVENQEGGEGQGGHKSKGIGVEAEKNSSEGLRRREGRKGLEELDSELPRSLLVPAYFGLNKLIKLYAEAVTSM